MTAILYRPQCVIGDFQSQDGQNENDHFFFDILNFQFGVWLMWNLQLGEGNMNPMVRLPIGQLTIWRCC